MTGKCVRDVERYQALLNALLQESENRACADCGAKGPRWASWNIGVFVCIRCAGIHRNLGVHISRVKSVNLDQWTQEQIQCMQEMGNKKTNRLYEAYLPDNFRRPQADLAVEAFIREKYEKKKYLDRSIDINAYRKEPTEAQRQSAESTSEARKATVVFEKVKMLPKREDLPPPKNSLPKSAEPVMDLLGLDAPVTTSSIPNGNPSSSLHSDLDLFASASSTPFSELSKGPGFLPLPATSSSVPENLNLFPESGIKVEESVKKQLSKDSILSLYGPQAPSMPPQGSMSMFMSPAQMAYPPAYSGFPGMNASSGLMSGMMAPAPSMVGPIGIPAGYMGCVQPPIMGLPNGMVAHQAGYATCMPTVPQPLFGVQPAQQMQWNVSQVNHQMAGLHFYSGNGMVAFGQPMGGGSAQAATQTLSSQVWK